MYATHCLMVIHPSAKYGKPMSKQTKVIGRTQKHVKNPKKFYLKVNVQGRIWTMNDTTHCLMVIHTCAKYGKPMSNQKSFGPDTNLHRQTDRQTDRATPIYPIELCSQGI